MKYIIALGLFWIINPFPNFLPAYNESKFIAIPLLAAWLWLSNPSFFIKRDLYLLGFLIIGAIGIFTSNHPDLVIHPLMGWVGIIGLAISLRPWIKANRDLFNNLLHLSFFLLLGLVSYGVFFKIKSAWSPSWVVYCSQNANYAAVLPIVYGSFFILQVSSKKVLVIFKLLLILLLGYQAWFLHSMLGVLLFLLLGLLFIVRNVPRKYAKIILVGVGILFVLAGLGLSITYQGQFFHHFEYRVIRVLLSFIASLQFPGYGLGLGNWQHDIYHLTALYPFELKNLPTSSFYLSSHEMLPKLFAEVGFVGGALFSVPLAISIYKNPRVFLPFVLIVPALFSLRIAYSNEQTYNEIPLLLFLFYSLSTSEDASVWTMGKFGRPIIGLVLGIAVVWNAYWFYNNHQYLKSIQLPPKASIELLESIRHPFFKRHVGADSDPIDWVIAQKYRALADKEQAAVYYERCYQSHSWNIPFLADYLSFLKSVESENYEKVAAHLNQLRSP